MFSVMAFSPKNDSNQHLNKLYDFLKNKFTFAALNKRRCLQ